MKAKNNIINIYKRKSHSVVWMFFALILFLFFSSCEKYLDKKPEKTLILIESLDDVQVLLNNFLSMNQRGPRHGEPASDNFVISWAVFESYTSFNRPYFIWEADAPSNSGEWNGPYEAVLYANMALSSLEDLQPNITAKEQERWNHLRGAALFFRAFQFHQLLEVFAMPYNSATADTDLGIPLRTDPDVNLKYPRASVQESFDKIILDLKEAADLLPNTSEHQTQPGKDAVYGLLSRVYLSMGNYDAALSNATKALEITNNLVDFNTISFFVNDFEYPEIIFYNSSGGSSIEYSKGTLAPDLLASYDATDLRTSLFFNANGKMVGSYSGEYWNRFIGIAVDEIILTRAECYARNNQLELAVDDLNALLVNRYETGTFTDYVAADFTQVELVKLILLERRKELIYRNIRWMDIRRLNTEADPNYMVGELTKTFVDNPGQTYSLPVGDLRYAFLLPEDVILKGGYKQNPR